MAVLTARCGTETNLQKTAGVAVPSVAKQAEKENVDGKFALRQIFFRLTAIFTF
jgi:hypothetical protein